MWKAKLNKMSSNAHRQKNPVGCNAIVPLCYLDSELLKKGKKLLLDWLWKLYLTYFAKSACKFHYLNWVEQSQVKILQTNGLFSKQPMAEL